MPLSPGILRNIWRNYSSLPAKTVKISSPTAHCAKKICRLHLPPALPVLRITAGAPGCWNCKAARRAVGWRNAECRVERQRAQISPTGGWRCAKCRVERDVCTDDYGQQRTETDNTDDRPAGVQNKPYLHKPRKRRYPPTTTRLPGNRPATGAFAKNAYFRRDMTKPGVFCQREARGAY